jgi:hypothetical protein
MCKLNLCKVKKLNVFEPFFAFAHTFNSTHAHNMCAFQLDPQFK